MNRRQFFTACAGLALGGTSVPKKDVPVSVIPNVTYSVAGVGPYETTYTEYVFVGMKKGEYLRLLAEQQGA